MKFWQSRLRAEELGISGYSLMRKSQLEEAITNKINEVSKEGQPQPQQVEVKQ
jgi:hypothetical protein